MFRVLLAAVVVILLLIVGGLVYLAYVDVPVPTTKVEKVLPDDRFPK